MSKAKKLARVPLVIWGQHTQACSQGCCTTRGDSKSGQDPYDLKALYHPSQSPLSSPSYLLNPGLRSNVTSNHLCLSNAALLAQASLLSSLDSWSCCKHFTYTHLNSMTVLGISIIISIIQRRKQSGTERLPNSPKITKQISNRAWI